MKRPQTAPANSFADILKARTAGEGRSCRVRRGRGPALRARMRYASGCFRKFTPWYGRLLSSSIGPASENFLTERSIMYTLLIERLIKGLSWSNNANMSRNGGADLEGGIRGV